MTGPETARAVSPAVVFAVAALAAAVFALLPLRTVLTHYVYEDMFYYLRIAEFLAAGAGSTFDGTEPTNGYHALWMGISALAALGLQGEALMRAMLLFAALLHGVQAMLIHRIALRHVPALPALLATALFALNWRTIATNLCGLETPLAVVAVLLVIDRLDLWTAARKITGWRQAVALGGLLAFAVLARFDQLLFAGIAGLWFTWFAFREGGAGLALRQAVITGAVGLFLLLPWVVFSLEVSGTVLPNSRAAVALLIETGAEGFSARLHDAVFGGVYWIPDSANLFGLWPLAAPTGRGAQVAALIFALFVLGVVAAAIRMRRDLPPVVWLCLAFFLAHSAYYMFNHRLEVRYLLSAHAALIVAAALVMGRIAAGGHLRAVSGAFAALWLVAGVAGIDAWSKNHGSTRTHGGHGGLYDAALWLRETAPDARVGAWNAGILSFFSRAEVVNLDGVVNDAALAAMQERAIGAYIEDRGIAYLADNEGQIETNLARFASDPPEVSPPAARFGSVVVLPVAPAP